MLFSERSALSFQRFTQRVCHLIQLEDATICNAKKVQRVLGDVVVQSVPILKWPEILVISTNKTPFTESIIHYNPTEITS